MPKIVNTALKAKAKAKAWTFEAKAKAKATGPEAKAIKFGLEAKAWPRGLHHCKFVQHYRQMRQYIETFVAIVDIGYK